MTVVGMNDSASDKSILSVDVASVKFNMLRTSRLSVRWLFLDLIVESREPRWFIIAASPVVVFVSYLLVGSLVLF